METKQYATKKKKKREKRKGQRRNQKIPEDNKIIKK